MTQRAAESLYEEDFARWIEQQARALRELGREGANLPLDWENLAEEIEALGRSERRELRNRLATILPHLLKLEASPAAQPRAKWRETVRRERREVMRGVLRDSPSLRVEVAGMIAVELPDAKALAAENLEEHGELDDAAQARLTAASYTEAQVLGDWFPDAPEARA